MADKVVAVGLLTERDLAVLGTGFRRAYPVEEIDSFMDLLKRIDEAEGNALDRAHSPAR